jgi:hypothetical protein
MKRLRVALAASSWRPARRELRWRRAAVSVRFGAGASRSRMWWLGRRRLVASIRCTWLDGAARRDLRAGRFDANHSESWLAVKPGTEDLIASSKFFFDNYSTFYMFYLGTYRILDSACQQSSHARR